MLTATTIMVKNFLDTMHYFQDADTLKYSVPAQ